MTNPWHHLGRLQRQHPRLSYTLLALIAAGATLALGTLSTPENQRSLTHILDNAGIIAGLVSMVLAWPLAILAWVRRQEARHQTGAIGMRLANISGQFKASLIISSLNCQPEWHLRHIRPERAEFLTTAYTREATLKLLDAHPAVKTLFDYREGSPTVLNNPQAESFDTVYRRVVTLLQSLLETHPREEICVDITAGTTIMSVAAFQAAESLGISTLYLRGTHRNARGLLIIDNDKVSEPDSAEVILVADHLEDPHRRKYPFISNDLNKIHNPQHEKPSADI